MNKKRISETYGYTNQSWHLPPGNLYLNCIIIHLEPFCYFPTCNHDSVFLSFLWSWHVKGDSARPNQGQLPTKNHPTTMNEHWIPKHGNFKSNDKNMVHHDKVTIFHKPGKPLHLSVPGHQVLWAGTDRIVQAASFESFEKLSSDAGRTHGRFLRWDSLYDKVRGLNEVGPSQKVVWDQQKHCWYLLIFVDVRGSNEHHWNCSILDLFYLVLPLPLLPDNGDTIGYIWKSDC